MADSNPHRRDRLEGAVALVTGANRGIGLAFVEELLERGVAKVYAGVRDPIASAGAFTHSAAEVIQLDVTTLTSVEQAAGRCGDTTILINNAGYHARDRLVLADDPEAARQEMEVNYFGVLNMTRAFAPVLGANGGGGIINVLSVAGAFPTAFMGGYSPAKAAALWLSTIARAELSAQGTAVTALIVGSVDTRMAEHVAGRKEDPRHIARVGLDAYLRGERVSDTDYMAVQARADYARDPALWERRVAKLVGSDNLSTGR